MVEFARTDVSGFGIDVYKVIFPYKVEVACNTLSDEKLSELYSFGFKLIVNINSGYINTMKGELSLKYCWDGQPVLALRVLGKLAVVVLGDDLRKFGQEIDKHLGWNS